MKIGDRVKHKNGNVLGVLTKNKNGIGTIVAKHLPKKRYPMGMFHPCHIVKIKNLIVLK